VKLHENDRAIAITIGTFIDSAYDRAQLRIPVPRHAFVGGSRLLHVAEHRQWRIVGAGEPQLSTRQVFRERTERDRLVHLRVAVARAAQVRLDRFRLNGAQSATRRRE